MECLLKWLKNFGEEQCFLLEVKIFEAGFEAEIVLFCHPNVLISRFASYPLDLIGKYHHTRAVVSGEVESDTRPAEMPQPM